jgi:hypothetical protein
VAAIHKYSKIVEADPSEFLSRLVSDFCGVPFADLET